MLRHIIFVFGILLIIYLLDRKLINKPFILQENNEIIEPIDTNRYSEIEEKTTHKSLETRNRWINPYPDLKDVVNHHAEIVETIKKANKPRNPNSVNERTKNRKFNPPDQESVVKPTLNVKKGNVKDERAQKPDETTGNVYGGSGGGYPKDRQICGLDNTDSYGWLNKLVLKIEKESKLEHGTINFPIDPSIFYSLKEMSTAESLEISKLDELICNMIDQSVISRIEVSDRNILSDYAKDIEWLIALFLLVTVCAYIIHRCIVHRPTTISLCCIIFCAVFWHWMQIHKQRHLEAVSLFLIFLCLIIIIFCYYRVAILFFMWTLEPETFSGGDCVTEFESSTSSQILQNSVEYKVSSKDEELSIPKSSKQDENISMDKFETSKKYLYQTGNQDLQKTTECEILLKNEDVYSPKSLLEDEDLDISTCEILTKCSQHLSVDQFVNIKVKNFECDQRKNLSISETSSFLEHSDIEDDISIIDSNESNSDCENQLIGQNLEKETVSEINSFHFTPVGYDSLS